MLLRGFLTCRKEPSPCRPLLPVATMSVADLVASLTAGLMPEQLAVMQNENHDVEVYTVAVVFSALAIASVILRLTSRHLKSAALMGIDDALMVGALVSGSV